MRLQSVQDLKAELLSDIVEPIAAAGVQVRRASTSATVVATLGDDASMFGVGARSFGTVPDLQRSLALGIAPHAGQYRLAIRLQRVALRESPVVEHLKKKARGEVDVRLVGRIDKRSRPMSGSSPRRAAVPSPWYRGNTRPLLIGASVGHAAITAGTLGAFVERDGAICMLSNNHVLANEGLAKTGDRILQRARLDGGRVRSDVVARLTHWVALKRRGANVVDAALGALDDPEGIDRNGLRALVNGRDRRLRGLGPEFVDEGHVVHKIGRTTGPTRGRVTAFDMDNVVVSFDVGNLRFDGQIEIEGTGRAPFSDGGDSGSLVLNSRMEAVGLLFAGSDTGGRNGAGLTYANPIHSVLRVLRASLLS